MKFYNKLICLLLIFFTGNLFAQFNPFEENSDSNFSDKEKLKINYNAPIVLTFVITCFIVTLMGMITNGRITDMFFVTYHSSLKTLITDSK